MVTTKKKKQYNRPPSLSATIKKSFRFELIAFLAKYEMNIGNTLKSLIVWWMNLPLADKKKFLTKYGVENKVSKDDTKTSLHVYLSNPEDKKIVELHCNELSVQLGDPSISFTRIIVSLVNWFMNLNDKSVKQFKEKYYITGKNNTLADIHDHSVGAATKKKKKATKKKVVKK